MGCALAAAGRKGASASLAKPRSHEAEPNAQQAPDGEARSARETRESMKKAGEPDLDSVAKIACPARLLPARGCGCAVRMSCMVCCGF